MTIKYYLVGGAVRDKILNKKSKDLDFAVEAPSYEAMKADIVACGGTIFLEKPEYLTIRAKRKGIDADYVLCRRDGAYYDGRRPDAVEPGTLADDLARRDFTMNAIAEDENGELVDPFNGVADINAKLIRCVGNTRDRLMEDSLRMLRAIRFSITKGFTIHDEIWHFMYANPSLLKNVSEDRIRDEIGKCLRFDTLGTLRILSCIGAEGIRDYVFSKTNIWLKPTSEGR